MKRYYEQDPKGHVWKLNSHGELDVFALDCGHHNGPECVNCGYSFCHHCESEVKQTCTNSFKDE